MSSKDKASAVALQGVLNNAQSLKDVEKLLPDDKNGASECKYLLISWINKKDWKELSSEFIQEEILTLIRIHKRNSNLIDKEIVKELLSCEAFIPNIGENILHLISLVHKEEKTITDVSDSLYYSISLWLQKLLPTGKIQGGPPQLPDETNNQTTINEIESDNNNTKIESKESECSEDAFPVYLMRNIEWWIATYHRLWFESNPYEEELDLVLKIGLERLAMNNSNDFLQFFPNCVRLYNKLPPQILNTLSLVACNVAKIICPEIAFTSICTNGEMMEFRNQISLHPWLLSVNRKIILTIMDTMDKSTAVDDEATHLQLFQFSNKELTIIDLIRQNYNVWSIFLYWYVNQVLVMKELNEDLSQQETNDWNKLTDYFNMGKQLFTNAYEQISSGESSISLVARCSALHFNACWESIGLQNANNTIQHISDEIKFAVDKFTRYKCISKAFFNEKIQENLNNAEKVWEKFTINQMRKFLQLNFDENTKIKINQNDIIELKYDDDDDDVNDHDDNDQNEIISIADSNDFNSQTKIFMLDDRLVASCEWLFILTQSSLFQFIWNENNTTNNTPTSNNNNDYSRIIPASIEWKKFYQQIETQEIEFKRLKITAPFLYKRSERTLLSQTANSFSFNKDKNIYKWIVNEKNKSWTKKLARQMKDWKNLLNTYGAISNIHRILNCFSIFLKSSGLHSLDRAKQSAIDIENYFQIHNFDDCKLKQLHDLKPFFKDIYPCSNLNPLLFETIIDSWDLLIWLRELSDDTNFTSSIEEAMGKSEMECPVELWQEQKGKPGRVDEQKLSMLSTVRGYLHDLIYRVEDKLDDITQLIKILKELRPTDNNVIYSLKTTNEYRLPLMELLNDNSDNAAPDRLLQLLQPTRKTHWICKTKIIPSQEPHDENNNNNNQSNLNNDTFINNYHNDDDDDDDDNCNSSSSSSFLSSSNNFNIEFQLYLQWYAPRNHGVVIKTQNRSELTDFQSTIVLSKTDQRSEEIVNASKKFIQQFVWFQQLFDTLINLHHSGHFNYQTFEYKYSIHEEPNKIKNEALNALKILEEWNNDSEKIREEYYFLNFYHTKIFWKFINALKTLNSIIIDHKLTRSTSSDNTGENNTNSSLNHHDSNKILLKFGFHSILTIKDMLILINSDFINSNHNYDNHYHHHYHHYHDILFQFIFDFISTWNKFGSFDNDKINHYSAKELLCICGKVLNSCVYKIPCRERIVKIDKVNVYVIGADVFKNIHIICTDESSSSSSKSVFDHILSIYARAGYFPEREFVYICRPTTTWNDVYILLLRWARSHLYNRNDKIYCIGSVEHLNFEIQRKVVLIIKHFSRFAKNPLILVSGQSDHQHIVTQFTYCRASVIPLPDDILREYSSYLSNHYSNGIYAITANHAGAGKSFEIRKMASNIHAKYISVPIMNSKNCLLKRIINSLQSNSSSSSSSSSNVNDLFIQSFNDNLLLHFDLFDTIQYDFDSILFDLIFIGGIEESYSGNLFYWFPKQTTLAFEIPAGSSILKKLRICSLISQKNIEVSSKTFQSDYSNLLCGMGNDDFFTSRNDGTCVNKKLQNHANSYIRLQYVCTGLYIIEKTQGRFPYVGGEEENEEDEKISSKISSSSTNKISDYKNTLNYKHIINLRKASAIDSHNDTFHLNNLYQDLSSEICFNLLVSYLNMEDKKPSLWCIWNFINVFYWQLRDMHAPDSPINCACMPDMFGDDNQRKSKTKIKGEVIQYLIRTAREFATRQVKNARANEIVGIFLNGFRRYDWNGFWERMEVEHDGKPAFYKTMRYSGKFFLYFRKEEEDWVIDDIIEPEGPVFARSERGNNINGRWFTSPDWTNNPKIVIRSIKHENGYNGEAIVVSGCLDDGGSASTKENGIYVRQPPYDDISNHPHYIMHISKSERRHLFWGPDDGWQISPVCNNDEGAFCMSLTNNISGLWRSMPPDIEEDRGTIEYIYKDDEQKYKTKNPISYQLSDVHVRDQFSPPNTSKSSNHDHDPDHGTQIDSSSANSGSHKDDDDNSMISLWDNTLKWNDGNHESLLFSNETHVVSFLSLNPKELREKMHPGLLAHLERNEINVGENLDQLSSDSKFHTILGALTGVYRTMEEASLLLKGNDNYCLTGDNLLKMLAIYARLRCGVPVVLMGECGCGKTMLFKFLCAWINVKLFVMDVHGGTSEYEIIQLFKNAEKTLINQKQEKVFVFLDEINTCSHMGIICEIICHRSIYGKKLLDGIYVLAALNPYRLRKTKLTTPGLVYQHQQTGGNFNNNQQNNNLPLLHNNHTITTNNNNPLQIVTNDYRRNLDNVLMSQLVYCVHPIPHTLRDFMFDFGSLSYDKEKLYIHSMTSNQFPSISVDSHKLIASLIQESQEYIRKIEKEKSATSLRDATRCLDFIKWFYTNHYSKNDYENDENISKLAVSTVLGLAFVYFYRLENQMDRENYWNYLGEQNTNIEWQKKTELTENGFWSLKSNRMFEKVLFDIENEFCSHVEVEDGIAMNQALRENLFVVIICILTKTPIFVVGKPGSSKTLTMQVIASNLQGKQSQCKFWRKYPAVYIFPYQCSPMSDSHSIRHQFDMAVRYQEHAENTITILLLDEVGLAEHSPDMPLKVLHAMLVDPPIAIVGLSNWILDPAKMNRAICLRRTEPSKNDITLTGKCIIASPSTSITSNNTTTTTTTNKKSTSISNTNKKSSKKKLKSSTSNKNLNFNENLNSNSLLNNLNHWLSPLAKAYHEIYSQQNGRDFFGMRDYYHLIKLLRKTILISPNKYFINNQLSPDLLCFALCRNFGGKKELLEKVLDSFYNQCYNPNQIHDDDDDDDDENTMNDLTIQEIQKNNDHFDFKSHFSPPPIIDLIHANLIDDSTRHLMLLTKNSSALQLLFGCNLLDERTTKVLIGSEFEDDKTELHLITQINQIKLAMANGSTIILLNHDNIYEALYDVLNQRYLYRKDQHGNLKKMLRLAIGSRSQLCQVADGFKIIVIVEQTHAYYSLDLPLLNRFEKQVLCHDDVLQCKQLKLVDQLKQWVQMIFKESGVDHLQDVFCGYHDGTIPSAVLTISNYNDSQLPNNSFEIIKQWFIRVSRPISIMNSKSLQSIYSMNDYFEKHSNFLSILNHYIFKNHHICSNNDEINYGNTFVVLTHSPISHLDFIIQNNKENPNDDDDDDMIISDDDDDDDHCKNPFGCSYTIIQLGELSSERQLYSSLQNYYQSTINEDSLLIVQCDPIACSLSLINHARYICIKERSQYIYNLKNNNHQDHHSNPPPPPKRHLVFLVHMPPGINDRDRHFTLDFISPWEYVFIDDLRLEIPGKVYNTITMLSHSAYELHKMNILSVRDIILSKYQYALSSCIVPTIDDNLASYFAYRINILKQLLFEQPKFLELVENCVYKILEIYKEKTHLLSNNNNQQKLTCDSDDNNQMDLDDHNPTTLEHSNDDNNDDDDDFNVFSGKVHLHVKMVCRDLLGGSLRQSLQLALEVFIIKAFAHVLRKLDCNFNLSTIWGSPIIQNDDIILNDDNDNDNNNDDDDDDSNVIKMNYKYSNEIFSKEFFEKHNQLQSSINSYNLWFALANNPTIIQASSIALDVNIDSNSAIVESESVQNMGKIGPFVSKFPFSYRIISILDDISTREQIESLQVDDYQNALTNLCPTLFGEEIIKLWNIFANDYHVDYLHDYVAICVIASPGLRFSVALQLYEKIMKISRPDSLHSPAGIHCVVWENEDRLFRCSCILSNNLILPRLRELILNSILNLPNADQEENCDISKNGRTKRLIELDFTVLETIFTNLWQRIEIPISFNNLNDWIKEFSSISSTVEYFILSIVSLLHHNDDDDDEPQKDSFSKISSFDNQSNSTTTIDDDFYKNRLCHIQSNYIGLKIIHIFFIEVISEMMIINNYSSNLYFSNWQKMISHCKSIQIYDIESIEFLITLIELSFRGIENNNDNNLPSSNNNNNNNNNNNKFYLSLEKQNEFNNNLITSFLRRFLNEIIFGSQESFYDIGYHPKISIEFKKLIECMINNKFEMNEILHESNNNNKYNLLLKNKKYLIILSKDLPLRRILLHCLLRNEKEMKKNENKFQFSLYSKDAIQLYLQHYQDQYSHLSLDYWKLNNNNNIIDHVKQEIIINDNNNLRNQIKSLAKAQLILKSYAENITEIISMSDNQHKHNDDHDHDNNDHNNNNQHKELIQNKLSSLSFPILKKLLEQPNNHHSQVYCIKGLRNMGGIDCIGQLISYNDILSWLPLNKNVKIDNCISIPDPFPWLGDEYESLCGAVRSCVTQSNKNTTQLDKIGMENISPELLGAALFTQTILQRKSLFPTGLKVLKEWVLHYIQKQNYIRLTPLFIWLCDGCQQLDEYIDTSNINGVCIRQFAIHLILWVIKGSKSCYSNDPKNIEINNDLNTQNTQNTNTNTNENNNNNNTNNNSSNFLLHFNETWLFSFLFDPRNHFNSFLPSVPDDPFLEIVNASGTVGWYVCPNGHKYSVGQCTMPMEKAICVQCGKPIGGLNHVSVKGVRKLNEGDLRGDPKKSYDIENNESECVRLTSLSCRTLRFILHLIIILSNCIYSSTSPSSSSSPSNSIDFNLYGGIFSNTSNPKNEILKRTIQDWNILKKMTSLPSVDLVLILHSIFQVDFSSLDLKISQQINTTAIRNQEEKKLSLQIENVLTNKQIREKIQDIREELKVSAETSFIRLAAGETLWFEIHEHQLSINELPDLTTLLWRYREPVSFTHFKRFCKLQSKELQNNYRLLKTIMQEEKRLHFIGGIADILAWHKILFDIIPHMGISRSESIELTNNDIIMKIPGKTNQDKAKQVFTRFAKIFNEILPTINPLFECTDNPFINKQKKIVDLDGDGSIMDENTSIAFSLPSIIKGSDSGDFIHGVCTIKILESLVDCQNGILESIEKSCSQKRRKFLSYKSIPSSSSSSLLEQKNNKSISSQQQQTNAASTPPLEPEVADNQRNRNFTNIPAVNYLTPTKILEKQLIVYNRKHDLLPLLRIFSVQSLDYGEGGMLDYDLKMIQSSIENSFLSGKRAINLCIRHYQYKGDIKRMGYLEILPSKIKQESLPQHILDSICCEIDTHDRLTRLMQQLEVCIGFIASVGSSSTNHLNGNALLSSYVINTLYFSSSEWEDISTPSIRQIVCLRHLQSLFLALEEKLHGNPLNDVLNIFCENLPSDLSDKLKLAAPKLPLDIILPVFRGFLIKRLVSLNFDPSFDLKEYLEFASGQTVLFEDEDWWVYFPKGIQLKFAKASYSLLKDFLV